MKKVVLSAVLLVAFMTAAVLAEEVGSVNIPRNVMIKNVAVAAGTYTVHLVENDGKMMIELHKGGETVVSELAIIKPVEEESKYKVGVIYQSLRRDGDDDPLVGRILIRQGDNLYLLFCEK